MRSAALYYFISSLNPVLETEHLPQSEAGKAVKSSMEIDSFHAVNAERFPKALYLLLRKWHPRIGLSLVGWWKPPDNSYFTFFLEAVTSESPAPVGPETLSMYQGLLATPGWSAVGEQRNADQDSRRLSTDEMVAWIENVFRFDRLYQAHRSEVDWWRRATSLEESQRFLLAWNALGLASRRSAILTWGRAGEPESYEHDGEALVSLGVVRPLNSLHYTRKIAVSNHAIAASKRTPGPVDLWSKHLDGIEVRNLVTMIDPEE